MKVISTVVCLFIFFACDTLNAATLGIPSQYPDLKAAYAASSPGDIIEIEQSGTYLASNKFYIHGLSHDIEIAGLQPNTIIDLEGTWQFVSALNSQAPLITLKNISLINYNSTAQNAVIENIHGRVDLINCHVNQLSPAGINPYISNSMNLNISNCLIENSLGTFFCENLHVSKSNFLNNSRNRSIGFNTTFQYLRAQILNSTFNKSGSIVARQGWRRISVEGNLFKNNEQRLIVITESSGNLNSNSVTLVGNKFVNNPLANITINIGSSQTDTLFLNNLFSNNDNLEVKFSSQNVQSKFDFFHNTIADNMVLRPRFEPVLFAYHQGNINIKNNIFWNPRIAAPAISITSSPASGFAYDISYNNLNRSQSGLGVGNISAQPLFINPRDNDYHIAFRSPCINTGQNLRIAQDLDNNLRDSLPDIGCDEFAPHIYLSGDVRPYSTNLKLNLIGYPHQKYGFITGDTLNIPLNTPLGYLWIDPPTLTPFVDLGVFGITGHYSFFIPPVPSIEISAQGIINNTLTSNIATLTIK